jgi:hypothetical protein
MYNSLEHGLDYTALEGGADAPELLSAIHEAELLHARVSGCSLQDQAGLPSDLADSLGLLRNMLCTLREELDRPGSSKGHSRVKG